MKFKLIKTYPGSPELGTIIYEAHNSLWYFARPNNEYLQHSVETIKSNPEYWQPETEYNLKWANSILGNMTACAAYLSQHGHADLCKQLNQQTKELFDYFENNLK